MALKRGALCASRIAAQSSTQRLANRPLVASPPQPAAAMGYGSLGAVDTLLGVDCAYAVVACNRPAIMLPATTIPCRPTLVTPGGERQAYAKDSASRRNSGVSSAERVHGAPPNCNESEPDRRRGTRGNGFARAALARRALLAAALARGGDGGRGLATTGAGGADTLGAMAGVVGVHGVSIRGGQARLACTHPPRTRPRTLERKG